MTALLLREVMCDGEVTDLLVEETRIARVVDAVNEPVSIIEGRGLSVLPAPIDVHVHFRDPGFTEKEDLLTGARAAAAGGFSTVLCEPNTRPVIDTSDQVSIFYNRASSLAIPLSVLTKAAVTIGEQGETLTDVPALAAAGAVALSDDGEPLVNVEVLKSAFRATAADDAIPLVITAHCEETPRAAAKVRAALGTGPEMAREVEIIRLHLQALTEAGNGRLHIQHVSLTESVALIADAKRCGLSVTAEVTPHHLLLCAEDIPRMDGEADANWKMNPPLRSRADMMAIRCALATGIIDMVATDHAPHTLAEKAVGWDDAPLGVIGLETAMGVYLSLAHDGAISWKRLLDALGAAPARLLPAWASSCIGGSLTLVDTRAKWCVDPNSFYSKSRNCPFAGRMFHGKVIFTIAQGRVVCQDGQVLF